MMTLLDIYEDARALIADEACWTTGFFARNGKGNGVVAIYDGAVAWCAAGALWRAAGYIDAWLLVPLAQAMGPLHLDDFDREERVLDACMEVVGDANDQYGHERVLEAFDEAIEILRAREREANAVPVS